MAFAYGPGGLGLSGASIIAHHLTEFWPAVSSGTLYLISTPIGNLEDLSPRAQRLLAAVGCIAAEDTRHSAKLLQHFGIRNELLALHDHNETQATPGLIERLASGQSIALISDAGTPLVSDPGYKLVQAAREAGITVQAIPGPSAALAALCVSGLPSDRFVFEGFLPAKSQARRQRIRELAEETRSLIFFESCHRIAACIDDLLAELGTARRLCIARELTKLHEESHAAPLGDLPGWLAEDANRRRGEFVLVLEGAVESTPAYDLNVVLGPLLEALPAGQAAKVAARITGLPRGEIYDRIQVLKGAE